MEERELKIEDNPVMEQPAGDNPETGEDTAPVERGNGAEAEDAAEKAPEGDDRESLLAMLDQEKSRAEDYYNRLVRMQADFENYRKRVAKEREELFKYASGQLVVALLPVMDNFERALAVKYDDTEQLLAGVEMIKRQLEDVLAREGLEPIPTVGEQFNPEIHEAVMTEKSEDYPENTITGELRRGFTLKGKVIRAAMVKVAG
ncbi:MAG: nucleotide exchange factor GrpE [Bacillota bacterium]